MKTETKTTGNHKRVIGCKIRPRSMILDLRVMGKIQYSTWPAAPKWRWALNVKRQRQCDPGPHPLMPGLYRLVFHRLQEESRQWRLEA